MSPQVRMLVSCACAALLVVGCHASSQPRSGPGQHDPLVEVNAEQLFARGQEYAAQGDFTRGEQYLVAALDKGYSIREVLPLLIEVCVRGNRYDTALYYARPQLERDPGNWRLRYLVGTLYSSVGNLRSARREFERVLVEAPEEAIDAHFALGKLLWSSDDFHGAKPHFARYLELAPMGAHVDEARVLVRMADQSVSDAQRPVRVDATDIPANDVSEGSQP